MRLTFVVSALYSIPGVALAFQPPTLSSKPLFNSITHHATSNPNTILHATRRNILQSTTATLIATTLTQLLPPSNPSANAAPALQDSLPIEEFLRTGLDPSGPMGISAQAGKSRPVTGVVFRDGTDVLQGKNGDVSAEILVGSKADPKAVLVSFNAPYKLETGTVFDVECRDGKTGDGAFLAVSEKVNGKSLEELPSSFFLGRLFDPTGRFSFYGPPTDVKVKKSTMISGSGGDVKRVIEVSFSNLSQSTNAEIPRNALLVATIPKGTENAVMLVASSNASRWRNKGAEGVARGIVDSFRAIPAPKTGMKLRAKDRSGGTSLDL